MDPENDLGTIVRKFLPDLLKKKGVSAHQLKVLSALANCRTPQMGGSAMVWLNPLLYAQLPEQALPPLPGRGQGTLDRRP
jgi:hypothetical protein